MPIISNIRVRISMLKVHSRYFSFNYEIKIDNKIAKKGKYDSSHVWENEIEEFTKILKNGYAVQLALENLY